MMLSRFALQNGNEEGLLAALSRARLAPPPIPVAPAPVAIAPTPAPTTLAQLLPSVVAAPAATPVPVAAPVAPPPPVPVQGGWGTASGYDGDGNYVGVSPAAPAGPQSTGYDPNDPIFSRMDGSPGSPGSGMAINPRTGKLEQVYATYSTTDGGVQQETRRYFESDPGRPGNAMSLAGYAPGYYSNSGFNTLDELMSRVIPIGGLAALAAGGAGLLGAGAAAGEGGLGFAGAAPAIAPEAVSVPAAASAGFTDLPLAPAPAVTSEATLSSILNGTAGAVPAPVSDATLQAILDSANVPTVGQGVQVASAGELPPITLPPPMAAPSVDLTAQAAPEALAPSMPAAVPPVDPTFGGALTQTGAGQFENLLGQFGTTGEAAAAGAIGGAGAVTLADLLKTAGASGLTAEAVNSATNGASDLPLAPAPAPSSPQDIQLGQEPVYPDLAPPPPPSSPQDIQLGQTVPTPIGGGYSVDPATGNVVGGAAGGAATGAGSLGGTKLSDILSGDVNPLDFAKNLTVGDLSKVLGSVIPAAAGAYAANEQSKRLSDLSDKYLAIGAPSRSRYEASYVPGFTMANDPGYTDALDQTTKATLHGLSVTGNPADSPNAWAQTLSDVNSKFAYPALTQYRNQNASTGGYGAFNTAAPGAAAGAIGAQKGVYDALGAGAADIFNPPKSLADLLRSSRYSLGY